MDRRTFLLTSGAAAGVTALAGSQAALAAPDGADRGPLVAEAPEDALVITDGSLQVRLHPEFRRSWTTAWAGRSWPAGSAMRTGA